MRLRAAIAPSPLRRLPGVVLLVLALLWAQLLGLAHGVRHAGTPAYGVAKVVSGPKAPAFGPLAHLLAPAGDDGECRLYDQLGCAGPLLQLPVLVAALPPLWQAWAVLLPQRVPPRLGFAARAPPPSR